jgi:hypothetical protein
MRTLSIVVNLTNAPASHASAIIAIWGGRTGDNGRCCNAKHGRLGLAYLGREEFILRCTFRTKYPLICCHVCYKH